MKKILIILIILIIALGAFYFYQRSTSKEVNFTKVEEAVSYTHLTLPTTPYV